MLIVLVPEGDPLALNPQPEPPELPRRPGTAQHWIGDEPTSYLLTLRFRRLASQNTQS
jgi:hypothetical protein